MTRIAHILHALFPNTLKTVYTNGYQDALDENQNLFRDGFDIATAIHQHPKEFHLEICEN